MVGEANTQTEFVGDLNPEVTADVNLPSEETQVQPSEDWVKENTSENGKIFGQFDDMQSALEHYRKQEITHTNNMREIKNEQKAKQEEVQSVQADLEQEQTKANVLSSMSQELLDNGMVFTDDMSTKLEEGGLTKAEAQVAAYQAKEITESNYAVLGGQEQYNQAMEYATTIFDEGQQKSIMDSIKNNNVSPEFRELALLGLQSKMGGTQPSGEEGQSPRVSGRSVNEPSVQGYTSQEELFADRRASKRNPAMKSKYLAKLALTDDKVLSLH